MKIASSSLLAAAVLGLALTPACGLAAQQQDLAQDQFQLGLALQSGSASPGPDVSAYVSERLEPTEQEYMRHAMTQLPATMRERMLHTDMTHVSIVVVDAATHTAHYNRPEIAGRLREEPAQVLPGDDYPGVLSQRGRDSADAVSPQLTSCGASPKPGCVAGAGPYRRIFTPPVAAEVVCPSGVRRPCERPQSNHNNGYWVSGTVTTACKAGSFNREAGPVNEAGYSFLGGYSKTPSAPGGSIDAGLQYNYEDDPKYPKLDNYEMFIGISGMSKYVFASTNPPGDLQPNYILCGGSTAMELRVAPWEFNVGTHPGCVGGTQIHSPWQLKACGSVAFIFERGTGGTGQQYNSEVIVWVAPNISYGGWGQFETSDQGSATTPRTEYWPSATCGGCIFKWVTGIGQKTENLNDKATYTATWSKRGIAPWATDPGDLLYTAENDPPVPMTAKLTLCTEFPLWRGTYNAITSKEDCSDTPGVTGIESDVRVTKFTETGEEDSIGLPF